MQLKATTNGASSSARPASRAAQPVSSIFFAPVVTRHECWNTASSRNKQMMLVVARANPR